MVGPQHLRSSSLLRVSPNPKACWLVVAGSPPSWQLHLANPPSIATYGLWEISCSRSADASHVHLFLSTDSYEFQIFRKLEPYHYLPPGQDAATCSGLPARRSDWISIPDAAGNDDLWPIVLACWDLKPLLRPSVVSLREYILQNLAPKLGDAVRQCSGLLDDDVLDGMVYFFGTGTFNFLLTDVLAPG